MKNKMLFIFLALITLPFISSCDSTDSDEGLSEYISLNIGDLRQYVSVIDNVSYYQNWEVISKAQREDGLEVYATKWYMNEVPINDYRLTYHFIRDGYFYSTELSKADSSNQENPYDEQKLAKVNPLPGEAWTRNTQYPDIFTAVFIGKKSTPAGEFGDVYAFQINNLGMSVFYARNFGHIGAGLNNGEAVLANYVKVNGKERGQFISVNNSGIKKIDMSVLDKIRKNILGQL